MYADHAICITKLDIRYIIGYHKLGCQGDNKVYLNRENMYYPRSEGKYKENLLQTKAVSTRKPV